MDREHADQTDKMRKTRQLYDYAARLALADYQRENPQSFNPFRKRRPYTLSADTIEANQMYQVALQPTWTPDMEAQIIAYMVLHHI